MKTFARPTARHVQSNCTQARGSAPWRSAARFTSRLLAPRLQAKLTIGAPNDRYEKEANRVADTVLRMPDPTIAAGPTTPLPADRVQRLCPECEEELQRQPVEEEEEMLQTRAAPGQTPSVEGPTESAVQQLEGRGQPLSESARAFLEPRIGADFSKVRVHRDAGSSALAQAIGARAFTVGRNVVFGAGEYAPESSRGRHLLAHELTHVVQQGGARTARKMPARTSPRRGAPMIQRLPFGVTLPTGMRFLDPTERAIAAPVYGSSLDFAKILLSDAVGGGSRPYTVYLPGLSMIVINIGPTAYGTPGSNPTLLVHELGHAWQSQHHPNPVQFMANSIASQAAASAAGGTASAYCYVPGKWFGLYGAEQISQQIERGEAPIISHVKSASKNSTDLANVASLAVPRWENRGGPGVRC